MDFFDVIEKRHSVRAYTGKPVEEAKLKRILEAARLAPTACNRQAFKVVVVPVEKYKSQLQKVYRGEWFLQAPLVLAVCSDTTSCYVRSDHKSYSDVDAAIVMDHIILASAAQGLGTCWIANFNDEEARKVLDLQKQWEPVAFTPLGYAAQAPVSKVRKTLEDIIVFR